MIKRYEKYRVSVLPAIDRVPDHWQLIKLKFIGKLYSGLTGKSGDDFYDLENPSSRPYINFKNIASNIKVDPSQFDVVVINHEDQQNQVQKGDLFFLMSSENFDDIGKTALLDVDLGETYLNSFCRGFRLTDRNFEPGFLNYLLLSNFYRQQLSIEAKGFTRINIQVGKIQNFNIYAPRNKSEQTKIAQYLDHQTSIIDQLIQQKEKLIELLKEKRQAVINEAVTKGLNPNAKMKDSGIEWLGEVPEAWSVIKLKHVVEMKSGNFISADMIKDEGVYPVYGGNGIRGYHSTYSHEGFFPLIGRQGALCGNINYANGKFWPTEHAVVVSPKKQVESYWIGELLRIMNLNQYSQAAAQPGLSVEKIINLRIPFPIFEEQKAIAEKLKKLNEKFESADFDLRESILKLKEYRQSIISEAVTGKIDVRDWQPNKKEVA